jgi:hypothetical protein
LAGDTLHMGTQCAGYQSAISKANASIRSGVKEVILDWQSSYTFQNKRSEAGSIINRKPELVKSATLQASKHSQDLCTESVDNSVDKPIAVEQTTGIFRLFCRLPII